MIVPPCADVESYVKVSELFSGSVPESVMPFGVSSVVETLWSVAVGGSFVAVTVVSAVATFESSWPSLTLNVIERLVVVGVFDVLL